MDQKYTIGRRFENQISVDSLKLRIPIDQVTVLNQAIVGKKAVINLETGDIEREFKENSHKHVCKGYSVYYGIEKQTTANQTIKEFLVLLLNSKILHDRYFEGLTMDTIETVYYRILEHGHVDFTLADMLNGEVVDVDFKRDLINPDFNDSLKTLVQYATPFKRKDWGYNLVNKDGNKGIEFGSRTRGSYANPFLKLYHKGLELYSKSLEFKNEYLSEFDEGDLLQLVRVETTVKNRKHFKKFGIEDTRLINILSLNDETLKLIFTWSMEVHLEKRTKTRNMTDGLTPTDNVLLSSITALMDRNMTFDIVRSILISGISKEKKSYYNMNNRLETLYQDHIVGSDLDTFTKQQDDFFAQIGWK